MLNELAVKRGSSSISVNFEVSEAFVRYTSKLSKWLKGARIRGSIEVNEGMTNFLDIVGQEQKKIYEELSWSKAKLSRFEKFRNYH